MLSYASHFTLITRCYKGRGFDWLRFIISAGLTCGLRAAIVFNSSYLYPAVPLSTFRSLIRCWFACPDEVGEPEKGGGRPAEGEGAPGGCSGTVR